MLNDKKEIAVFDEIKRLLKEGQDETASALLSNLFMSTGELVEEMSDYIGMSADLEENYLDNLTKLAEALEALNGKEKEIIKSIKIKGVRNQLLGNN